MAIEEDYQNLVKEVQIENQDQIAEAQKLAKGAWYKRAPKVAASAVVGASKGALNAGADVFNTATDLGFYAGAGADAAFSDFMGEDKNETEERVAEKLKKVQAGRDKLINYIKQEETDDAVANFTMGATESIIKYGTIYKGLSKTGLGVISKAGVAGFGEGFMDDVKNEMVGLDKGLRLAIEQVSPDSLDDFDKLTDINTDSTAAQQLAKRVMSGVEMGLFSAAGEKVIPMVGSGIGAAGQTVAKHIPESMKRTAVDGFNKVLMQSRKLKEYISKPEIHAAKTLDQYITAPGESTFEVVKGSFSPDKTAKQNIFDNVKGTFDESATILDDASYSSRLAEYEQKLADLAPQIEDEVINMANARGIAKEEALSQFAKEVGIDETQSLTQEGLKNVLRGQAHNILLEQQASAFALAVANKNKGIIGKEQYIETAKSLNNVIKQRMSLLTGAGRTLRGAQEIPDALKGIQKEIVDSGQNIDEIMSVYGKTLDDPAALEAMSEQMEKAFDLHGIVGDTPDDVMKAMAKALTKVDKTKAGKDAGISIGRAFASVYQANLLSSTVTLSQNTFGSIAQMMLRASDTAIEAGVSKLRGRQAGDATFREAYIQLQNIISGHWDAIKLSAKAAKNIKEVGFGNAGQTIRSEFSNIPQMSAREKDFMLQLDREETSSKLAPVGKSMIANFFAKTAQAGQNITAPIFSIIKTQDTIAKSIAARSFMRGRFHTAVYVDDVLGLGEGLANPEQAKMIVKEMFERGDSIVPLDALKSMGIDEKKAIDISQRLAAWKNQTSEQATDFALDVTMQTPLTGAAKSAQKLLQDTMPYGLGRFIVPFFTTPVNIINDALQRMPVFMAGEASAIGLPVHPKFYKDFMAGGELRNKAIARLTTGTAISQASMMLAERDIIQYTPSDIDQKISMDSMLGVQPGSINVGGESIPLAPLGAAGILLNFGAALNHYTEFQNRLSVMSDDVQNKFLDASTFNLISVMEVIREAPYAQAFDDIASGLFGTDFDDKKQIERFKEYLARSAGNMVPYSSLQRQFWNNIMEEKTRANGLWQSFKSSFAPYGNMKASNAFGEPMTTTKGVVARYTEIKDDPVTAKLIDGAGFYPTPIKVDQMLQANISEPMVSVRLDVQQYERLNDILRDKLKIRDQFERLVNSPRFAANTESVDGIEQNKTDANALMNQIRKQALSQLVNEDPDMLIGVSKQAQRQRAKNAASRQVPAGVTVPSFGGR